MSEQPERAPLVPTHPPLTEAQIAALVRIEARLAPVMREVRAALAELAKAQEEANRADAA